MKKVLLLSAAVLVAMVLTPHHALAFGVRDVVEMAQDGVSDDLILEKIEHSGKTFHLDAEDIHDLKQSGVSDPVISAMLRTEDARSDDDYYDGGAYYSYPYPYSYTYPRAYIGFSIGRSHGYYGGRPYAYRGWVGGHEVHEGRRFGGYERHDGGGGYRGRGNGGYGGHGNGGGGGHHGH